MLSAIAAKLLGVLIPHTCPICECIVSEKGALCHTCWRQVEFITGNVCELCGLPFNGETLAGAVCAACNQHAPAFDKARAAILYKGMGANLITAFKYQDALHLGTTLERMIERAWQALSPPEDSIIIPVPMSYRKQVKRRYNQAALLAGFINRTARVNTMMDGLVRVKATEAQSSLHKKERQKNIRRAFAVNRKHATTIKDCHVILVDDVITTTATASECARILKQVGAKKVEVIAIARTPAD